MWFFFSVAAVAFPIAALFLGSRTRLRNPWLFSLGSFVCFALVCLDELFSIRRRCMSGDFGGIEDTIGAVLLITAAVAVAVAVLNAIALALACAEDK